LAVASLLQRAYPYPIPVGRQACNFFAFEHEAG
jgi:hypothetical protein